MFLSFLFSVCFSVSAALQLFGTRLNDISEIAQWRAQQTIGRSHRALYDTDDLSLRVILAARHLRQIIYLLSRQIAPAKNARLEDDDPGPANIVRHSFGGSYF